MYENGRAVRFVKIKLLRDNSVRGKQTHCSRVDFFAMQRKLYKYR